MIIIFSGILEIIGTGPGPGGVGPGTGGVPGPGG